jgi:hypothetical protein
LRRQAAYDALPKCFVKRDWLRLALKQLAPEIAAKPDDALIWFKYAAGILSITCDEERFVVSAKGVDWPKPVVVRVGEIRHLPRRLTDEEVPVVVGDSHLRIGAKYYTSLTDVDVPPPTSAVPPLNDTS